MGPRGKQKAEQLMADVDGVVLTTILPNKDQRYVDVIAQYPPAEILNALDGDKNTPGVMYRSGDILLHDKPALVVLGIGEIAIGNSEYALITLEDLAAKLPEPS